MKMIINKNEAKGIVENYVRRMLELTPEYSVEVTQERYEQQFEVIISKPDNGGDGNEESN